MRDIIVGFISEILSLSNAVQYNVCAEQADTRTHDQIHEQLFRQADAT